MKQSEANLLALLRASFREESAAFDADADWAAVLGEAKMQTVTALAAKGLPETLSKDQREPWKNAEYAQLANYVRYMIAQDELCRLFAEHDLPMCILKGSAAAIYYPQPSRRAMGDIDLLVLPERFEDARALMQGAGYTSDGDETERHIGFQKNGVKFELHHHFSYIDLDVEAMIRDGLDHVETGSVDGHEFPMLPRLANGIVLLAHMREHLRCGLGLRQVIDWMMYVEKALDDSFWSREFFAVAKEKNLDTLAITATRVCQMYLGLPESITWCAEADDELCDLLVESILSSGNFGRKNATGHLAGGVAINIRREGLFPYLQRVGERDWKLYHRHRWLRPFAWLREGFVFLKKYIEIRRRKKPVFSEMAQSRQRYELLQKLNLYSE